MESHLSLKRKRRRNRLTKKLHLICNSHIDPAWQWDWNEGLSQSISTFYQAAKFCDEYDYIFNHNESVLYEFIEKNDPKLFDSIKRLVKEGKWHIMGGWYIQPDCNNLSGESYVRHIEVGRRYFKEKFNVTPKVAMNFDSFGHSSGMPQILSKTGHIGYIFCRPMKHEQTFDAREFIWVSKDGSKIKAARAEDDMVYISRFGKAYEDISRKITHYQDKEIGIALWGVGNHGGVNSKKDLEDVTRLIKETKEFEIVHSTPEAYIEDINPTLEYSGPLQPKIIGSYSSMNSLKRLNSELERKLFNTEKLVSVAEIEAGYHPDYKSIEDATKAMLKLQFHDSLAGTVTQDAEKTTIELGRGALSTLENIETEAYLSIVSRELKAKLEENPIFLFNFAPYKRKAICEAEILLPDGLYSDTEELYLKVYQNGKELKAQRIKELGNFNYDRRIRMAFICELEPLNTTRIDFIEARRPKTVLAELDSDYVFENKHMKVRINHKTGLLDSYIVDSKELLNGGAFEPILSVSTENPWGHDLDRVTSNRVPFELSSCDHGITANLKQMKVVEDGDIFTKIQSIFEKGDNIVILNYKIYKEEKYIDVEANVFYNDKAKAIEFKIPGSFDSKFFSEVAYSTEYYPKDNNDKPTLRYVGLEGNNKKALVIYNDSIYSTSSINNDLYLLALNGAAHCAHKVAERDIIKDKSRYVPYIEEGKHTFNFRLSYDDMKSLESNSDEFLNKPFGFNYYPHGDGDLIDNLIEVSNKDITLKAFYKEGNHYILRLFNNTDESVTTNLKVKNLSLELNFTKYEVKTVVYDLSAIYERTNFID